MNVIRKRKQFAVDSGRGTRSLSDIRWCLIIFIDIYCEFTALWSRKKDPTTRDNPLAFVQRKNKRRREMDN